VTEAEWDACTDPKPMLEALRGRASDRQFQLFSCGCCRKVWHLLTAECSREAVEVSEYYADGRATEREVYAAREQAQHHFQSNYMHRNGPAYAAAYKCGWLGAPSVAALMVYQHLGQNTCPIAEPLHDDFFCQVVRDIIGNPFRPAALNPAWLAWNGGTVAKLAAATYEERRFADLPILADALEDAGCSDADLLGHLRGPGEHVRGCWAVDLLLGKSWPAPRS
jgi:hypothetical protein